MMNRCAVVPLSNSPLVINALLDIFSHALDCSVAGRRYIAISLIAIAHIGGLRPCSWLRPWPCGRPTPELPKTPIPTRAHPDSHPGFCIDFRDFCVRAAAGALRRLESLQGRPVFICGHAPCGGRQTTVHTTPKRVFFLANAVSGTASTTDDRRAVRCDHKVLGCDAGPSVLHRAFMGGK